MSPSGPPPAAVGRLPVLATVRQAYAIVLGNPGLLARAAAAPFLLSVLIATVTLATPSQPLVSFLLAIAGLAPFAIFGTAWCRLTLLGPAAGRPPLGLTWSARHWRFFGYIAAQAFIVFGLLLPPIMAGLFLATLNAGGEGGRSGSILFVLAELAVVFGAVYLAARLSFVFPAAAAGEIYKWRHAWAHTRGQGLRLLGAIALSIVPIMAVFWAAIRVTGLFALPEIEAATVQEGADPQEVIRQYMADNAGAIAAAQFAMTAMSYLVMAMAMSVISIAFRVSTGWIPAPAPPARE